jgi:peptidoglycan/LPS O-acetylase OafA/YrhL
VKGDGIVRSLVACAAMFCVFCFCDVAYSVGTALLLGAFFLLVVSGASLFGLLRLTGARRLGDISYSLYLMHGTVITLLFSYRPLTEFSLTGSVQYYATQALSTTVLLAVCVGTYLLIEKPGIALGRLVASSGKTNRRIETESASAAG